MMDPKSKLPPPAKAEATSEEAGNDITQEAEKGKSGLATRAEQEIARQARALGMVWPEQQPKQEPKQPGPRIS